MHYSRHVGSKKRFCCSANDLVHMFCAAPCRLTEHVKDGAISVMKHLAGRALARLAVPGLSLAYLLLSAQAATATQVHGPPEGLYAHQMAHILFIFSLIALVYWLRERSLVEDSGWRYVQYAAFFLILWNMDAVLAHYLDGRGRLFELINAGSWNCRIRFVHGSDKVALLYYFAKLDHLFCVPGIMFLYMGLRRLLKQV